MLCLGSNIYSNETSHAPHCLYRFHSNWKRNPAYPALFVLFSFWLREKRNRHIQRYFYHFHSDSEDKETPHCLYHLHFDSWGQRNHVLFASIWLTRAPRRTLRFILSPQHHFISSLSELSTTFIVMANQSSTSSVSISLYILFLAFYLIWMRVTF